MSKNIKIKIAKDVDGVPFEAGFNQNISVLYRAKFRGYGDTKEQALNQLQNVVNMVVRELQTLDVTKAPLVFEQLGPDGIGATIVPYKD